MATDYLTPVPGEVAPRATVQYPDPEIFMEDWSPDRPLPRPPKLWPTWGAYREFIRERNGGTPFIMWWTEMGVVDHLAAALHVDPEVLLAVLDNPGRFGELDLVCRHPAGATMGLNSVEQYEREEAEVAAHGGPEGWHNWMYPPRSKEERQAEKEERARRNGKPIRYWLYRIFGEEDRLLYIGVTRNPEGREKAHRKKWGDVIDRIEYVEYESHAELMADEARLIAEHNPPFNAQHVGGEV